MEEIRQVQKFNAEMLKEKQKYLQEFAHLELQSDGVEEKHPFNNYGLHKAIITGDYNLVENLAFCASNEALSVEVLGVNPHNLAILLGEYAMADLLLPKISLPNLNNLHYTIKKNAHIKHVKKLVHAYSKTACDGVDEAGQGLLHKSVINNALETTRLLLAKRVNIDLQDRQGKTVLHIAASKGYFALCKLLVTANGRVNLKDNAGDLPLHTALEIGYANLANLLITPETVNIANSNGEMPIHIAAKNGDIDVIHKLIENNASLDVQNLVNQTALYIAVARGDKEACQALIAANAAINIPDSNGDLPLHIAIRKGYTDIINLLITPENANIADSNGNMPIHIAVNNKDKNVVKTLIKRGAAINAQNILRKTALYMATEQSDVDLCNILVAAKANHNISTNNNLPIHIAAQNNNSKIVELLAAKTDLTLPDSNGDTALHIAAKHNAIDVFKTLIDHTDRVDRRNLDGELPIHIAARLGYHIICSMLLTKDKNASITLSIQNNEGCTPLELAANYLRQACVELMLPLLSKQALIEIIWDAVSEGKSKLLEAVLQLYPDLSYVTDNINTTLLHKASNAEIATMLYRNLKEGYLMKANKYGELPIHQIARQGLVATLAFLLEKALQENVLDIMLDYTDIKGSIALHYAGNKEVAQMLLNSMSFETIIAAINKRGQTVLHNAAKAGNFEVMEVIFNHFSEHSKDNYLKKLVNYKDHAGSKIMEHVCTWANKEAAFAIGSKIIGYMAVNAVVQSNPITGETLYDVAVSHDNKQLAAIILEKAPGILEVPDNQSIAAPTYRSHDSKTSQATMEVIENLSEVEVLKLLASKYKGNIKDALNAITIAAEDYIDDEDEKAK